VNTTNDASATETVQRPLPLDTYAILHIRPGPPWPEPGKTPQIAAAAPFELSSDIWIEKLDQELGINIQRACEPANHKIDNHVWDRHLYAFVRREPEEERRQRQLPGTVVRDGGIIPLFTVMALSRLVRPTTVGNRYCAKIYPAPATDPVIQALTISGANPDVTIADVSRDWLTPEDGPELRQLMPWVSPSKQMHPRVHRAFWNHEDAMRTYFLDFRLPLVVAGLEALTTVEKGRGLTDQFVRRVAKLTADFAIQLSETEIRKAYQLRSEVAHGRSFLYNLSGVLPQSEHRPLYDKLESLLRATVKTCLLDENFGRRFANDRTVLKNYP
jgi:hypothetical protein